MTKTFNKLLDFHNLILYYSEYIVVLSQDIYSSTMKNRIFIDSEKQLFNILEKSSSHIIQRTLNEHSKRLSFIVSFLSSEINVLYCKNTDTHFFNNKKHSRKEKKKKLVSL